MEEGDHTDGACKKTFSRQNASPPKHRYGQPQALLHLIGCCGYENKFDWGNDVIIDIHPTVRSGVKGV